MSKNRILIIFLAICLVFGTIPFAKGMQAIDLNIGVFFIMAAKMHANNDLRCVY